MKLFAYELKLQPIRKFWKNGVFLKKTGKDNLIDLLISDCYTLENCSILVLNL